MILIPGYELTTNKGHANFLGAVDPIDDFRVTHMDDIHKHFQLAKARGARRVLNHIHCDRLPWEWSFDIDYDYVEIWNGPWLDRNQRALDWWQEQLSSGRHIVAVGGSDVHRPDSNVKHAMPVTWVYAFTHSVEGILAGIDKGRVFISCSPVGPTIDYHIGSCMMGDTLQHDSSLIPIAASMTLECLEMGDRIRIISDQGLEEELLVSKEKGELSHSWAVDNRRFYRVEIWRHSDHSDQWLLAALSNPIYLQ